MIRAAAGWAACYLLLLTDALGLFQLLPGSDEEQTERSNDCRWARRCGCHFILGCNYSWLSVQPLIDL